MKYFTSVFTIITLLIATSCHCSKNNMTEFKPLNNQMLQQIIVYKTSKDYSDFIPVQLNDDGTKIISYPSPEDIFTDGKLAKPIKLKKGYWLDKRGITKNTVFVNITYDDYSKLTQAPSTDILFSKIIDKNPITELYNCGAKTTTDEILIATINYAIKNNQLKNCTCLKK